MDFKDALNVVFLNLFVNFFILKNEDEFLKIKER